MTPVESVAAINREIVAVWSARFSTGHPPVRWPMICPAIAENGLAVVGCNPALPKSNYYTVPIFQDGAASNE